MGKRTGHLLCHQPTTSLYILTSPSNYPLKPHPLRLQSCSVYSARLRTRTPRRTETPSRTVRPPPLLGHLPLPPSASCFHSDFSRFLLLPYPAAAALDTSTGTGTHLSPTDQSRNPLSSHNDHVDTAQSNNPILHNETTGTGHSSLTGTTTHSKREDGGGQSSLAPSVAQVCVRVRR